MSKMAKKIILGVNMKLMLLYVLILMLLVFCNIANAQTWLYDKNYSQAEEGISVIEFWAEFNQGEACDWIVDLKDCTAYRMDIESNKADELEIKTIPTIIVLKDGEEMGRFDGGLDFHLCPKTTPIKINELITELKKE